jgi:hypothetical protein
MPINKIVSVNTFITDFLSILYVLVVELKKVFVYGLKISWLVVCLW